MKKQKITKKWFSKIVKEIFSNKLEVKKKS